MRSFVFASLVADTYLAATIGMARALTNDVTAYEVLGVSMMALAFELRHRHPLAFAHPCQALFFAILCRDETVAMDFFVAYS